MMRTPAWLTSSIDTIEHAQALDAASRVADAANDALSGPAGDALRGRWLGHALHPLLTDLPLGCWLSSALLDLVGGRGTRKASQRLVGLGLVFVPITAVTGTADWADSSDERVRRVGAVHGVGNTVVALLYWKSWSARRHGQHVRGVVLGLAGGLLAVATGYLGGHMSFARGSSVEERGLHDGPVEDVRATEVSAGAW